MDDLQAAINTLTDGDELRLMTRYNAADFVQAIAVVVKAARRVANGETIWWCEVHEMKGIEDLCGWTRVKDVRPDTCRMVRKLLVDITEDTNAD